MHHIVFIFLPKTLLGRLTPATQVSGVPIPPFLNKFLATPMADILRCGRPVKIVAERCCCLGRAGDSCGRQEGWRRLRMLGSAQLVELARRRAVKDLVSSHATDYSSLPPAHAL